MESTPRPGYYPDPSVPGYIRYWDGSKWVPGTSKPMPKKAGGDAELTDTAAESDAPAPTPKSPAFATPRPLSEVSFDDAKPSESTFPSATPDFPQFLDFPAAPEPKAPSFGAPRPLSETNFDQEIPEPPHSAPQLPGFQVAAGPPAAPQAASAAGMGILITGAPGLPLTPKQTPAELSAANQSVRIRLLRPDGKPFDGPEITTGPKQSDAPQGTSRTEFDAPRGPKKQAPKIVVKAGPLERAGHTLAVLLISAVGVIPLGFLLMQSVHDREDKLAARISVPTKMNVLDSTSEAYLGGMVVVLLVVTALYWSRLKRRRER